jgi:hypothetical protein
MVVPKQGDLMPEYVTVERDYDISLHLVDTFASAYQFGAAPQGASLYYHMLTAAPRELFELTTWIRLGSPTLGPEQDRNLIATAEIPLMCMPANTGNNQKEGRFTGQKLRLGDNIDSASLPIYLQQWTYLKQIYHDMLNEVLRVEVHKEEEDGVLIHVGRVGISRAHVVPTPHFAHIVADESEISRMIRNIQAHFTALKPFGSGEYVGIGIASRGMPGGKFHFPKDTFTLGTDDEKSDKIEFKTNLRKEWQYSEARFYAMWQMLLAISAGETALACGDPVYGPFGDDPFRKTSGIYGAFALHAFAAMDLGNLSGWSPTLNQGVEMGMDGLAERVYPWLVHPFSRAYLHNHPIDVLGDEGAARRWLLHGILRYLISQKIGGLKGPVTIENYSKVTWHQAKAAAADMFNPPYTMGGSDPFWLMTGVDPKVNDLYDPIPYPVTSGKVRLSQGRSRPWENVSTLQMKYGEYQMPDLSQTTEEKIQRWILIVEREGRISQHRSRYRDIWVMRVPLVPRVPDLKVFSLASYLSDLGDSPGGVAAAFPMLGKAPKEDALKSVLTGTTPTEITRGEGRSTLTGRPISTSYPIV